MDKLRAVCESALVAGVMVNTDNIFELSRLALTFSCFSKPANSILEKCARFLRKEISRDFGILKRFGREDYDIFQVKSKSNRTFVSIDLENLERINSILELE